MKWLRIVRLCQTFHVLPHTGGLFAQPYGHVLRMEQAIAAQQAWETQEVEKSKARNRLMQRFSKS